LDTLYVRCGISSGSVCATNEVTGFNRGQITEISEICQTKKQIFSIEKYNDRIKLIADGGVKNSGCIVKAFGAGADYVMMGGYWKNCELTNSNINGDYNFFGGASREQLNILGDSTRHSEGKCIDIDCNTLTSFNKLDNQLWGGVLSGLAYSGYTSLDDFIGNGIFEKKSS